MRLIHGWPQHPKGNVFISICVKEDSSLESSFKLDAVAALVISMGTFCPMSLIMCERPIGALKSRSSS